MPRSRVIKPDLYHNEFLTTLPFETRYLAGGLPCWADKEGRLEDRPRKLKMEVFPADNVDVDQMLDQLQGIGYVKRYTVEGRRYIQIVKFSKHQKPHPHEPASALPSPEEGELSTGNPQAAVTCNDPVVTSNEPEHPLVVMGDKEREREKERARAKGKDRANERKARKREKENDFDRWWETYPKKVGKKRCLAVWMRNNFETDFLIADTLNRIDNDAKWARKKYIANPETYLNGERWHDELLPIEPEEETGPIRSLWEPPPELVEELHGSFDPALVDNLIANNEYFTKEQLITHIQTMSLN